MDSDLVQMINDLIKECKVNYIIHTWPAIFIKSDLSLRMPCVSLEANVPED